jgi:flagellar motor component MotA
MLALVGIAVVLAALFGGYLAEQRSFYVLLQPAELLIVGGAALGIVLIANRPAVIRKMARGAASSSRWRASEQVVEVRGFAAQHLLNQKDPNDPRNRRVSVVVRFQ